MNEKELFTEKLNVANMMVAYGGDFASNLGNALICADMYNTARIKSAFPEIWKQYTELYEIKNKQKVHEEPKEVE